MVISILVASFSVYHQLPLLLMGGGRFLIGLFEAIRSFS